MGNLECQEITTDGPEIEPMNHNMQIRKSEPQVHWLIAGVMSQRPSPNVAGSAVGQVSGQVEKLLLFGVCVSALLPFFNQLVLVSCISCGGGGGNVPIQPELKDSGPKSILFSCVVALRFHLCFEQK